MARTKPPVYMEGYKDGFVEDTAAFIHSYDMAHVVMLCETGVLPVKTGFALLQGLYDMQEEGLHVSRREAGGGNHAAERYLTQKLGPAVGGAIGLARSSGDLSAISFRMYARQKSIELRKIILALRKSLVDFARERRDDVLPGNTHGQHAQPITFALWAMMYQDALARDGERLAEFYARANRCPAGAGIMSGTDFPINRSRVAELLGFDSVMQNTLDAALSHDLEIEYASILNLLCYSLSRMAEDMFLWATTEYQLIVLPDWFVGTSSMMPQKRNPDGLQDLRNLSAQAQAMLTMVMGTERGPTGYAIIERRNSDRYLRALTDALAARIEVLPELLSEVLVDKTRAENHTNTHWAGVTDLAGAVVRLNGIDWRRAHHLVAGFVRECVAQHKRPNDICADDFNAYAARCGETAVLLNDAILSHALDAKAFVIRRDTFGGPGPEAMDAALYTARAKMAAEDQAIGDVESRITTALSGLQATVNRLLAERKF